jgi:hypothetical protein
MTTASRFSACSRSAVAIADPILFEVDRRDETNEGAAAAGKSGVARFANAKY